jgi:hypothetical protein
MRTARLKTRTVFARCVGSSILYHFMSPNLTRYIGRRAEGLLLPSRHFFTTVANSRKSACASVSGRHNTESDGSCSAWRLSATARLLVVSQWAQPNRHMSYAPMSTDDTQPQSWRVGSPLRSPSRPGSTQRFIRTPSMTSASPQYGAHSDRRP